MSQRDLEPPVVFIGIKRLENNFLDKETIHFYVNAVSCLCANTCGSSNSKTFGIPSLVLLQSTPVLLRAKWNTSVPGRRQQPLIAVWHSGVVTSLETCHFALLSPTDRLCQVKGVRPLRAKGRLYWFPHKLQPSRAEQLSFIITRDVSSI